MTRALHGAARQAVMEKQLREELSDYGLPMGEYTCEFTSYYDHDPELLMMATFTRKSNGRVIEITGVYSSDNGEVMQSDMPTLC